MNSGIALLNKKNLVFLKIYISKFNFQSKDKPVYFNNLPIFNKDREIGRATSIVWSPKYSNYTVS